MASEKRCLYEILGLTNRDCSPEEIRSAYRKLALQRHPDKLIQTGVPEEQATAAFQELVNAYEVLSDPRERAWYDSHRSQILFSDVKSSGASSVPDLFSFFSNSVFSGFGDTGKGFFKVYGDLFGKIYGQEVSFAKKLGLGIDAVRDSPLMGNLESPYTQVSAFYGYWLGFCTVMDFCWVDEYDAMAGPNRKSRRLMEEENKKLRKKAKRDYNDTVRGLAEFVKKRDKRVVEMQMKKNLELEKKKEEEVARKKEAERVKMERAMLYEEPEWAKIEEEEIEDVVDEVQDDNKKNELYCVVCSKKFKSDKQWKNHEQSKKHKEKVAELKYSIQEEEKLFGKQEKKVESMDDFSEQFEESLDLKDEQCEEVKNSSNDEEGTAVSEVNNKVGDLDGSDEETSVLKAMVSGRKNKKNAARKREPTLSSSISHVSPDEEEIDLMEYDSRRNSRRNRAAKKERGKKSNGESGTAEIGEITEEVPNKNNSSEEVTSNSNGHNVRDEEDEEHENVDLEDSVSHKFDESEPNNGDDPPLDNISKVQKKPVVDKRGAGKADRDDPPLDNVSKVQKKPVVDKRGAGKADTNTKLKNTSKGKKQKGASKNTDHLCDTCGEDFDSRNKLHKHLGDTGHASLKSR